jgi:hypothetical protein
MRPSKVFMAAYSFNSTANNINQPICNCKEPVLPIPDNAKEARNNRTQGGFAVLVPPIAADLG